MQIGDFYGQALASGSAVTGSTGSTVLMYSNPGGRRVLFFNHHPGALFLKFGNGATVTDFTVKLSSGSYYETPLPVHTGAFTGIWDAAGGRVLITVL